MTLKLPVLALTILALALAGCGSSDDTAGKNDAAGTSETSAPKPLTKTELIALADAICKQMQAKIDKIPEPESINELGSAIGKQIAISGPAIEDLKELNPPEDLASDYDAWTAKLDELQTGTEEVRDAAESGSEAQVEKVINEVDSVNTEADDLGKAIGFKVCAK